MSPERTRNVPLTTVAQQAVAVQLYDGARAIDATMGNGHDTLFLARGVGHLGRVIAFDIQPQAVQATEQRLAGAGLTDNVDLRLDGHQHLRDHIPANWIGRVDAVMFNLGYLPGGDKACITHGATTCQALSNALDVLRSGGILSLLLYRGHRGSGTEVEAVRRWLENLPATCVVREHESPGPVLYLVTPRSTCAD